MMRSENNRIQTARASLKEKARHPRAIRANDTLKKGRSPMKRNCGPAF